MNSVSVVIPVRDRAMVVGRAIRSAQQQTCPPFEIIVVDDGSIDDTRDVVGAAGSVDSRLRLLRLDVGTGAAAARNAGVHAATGTVLAFLDSDDEWSEVHLERGTRLLRESGAGLVFGSFHVDDGLRRVEQACSPLRGDPLEYLFFGHGGFRTSTFVCHKSSMVDVMFDDALQKHQDWDLMIRFLRRHGVATDTVPTAVLHTGGQDRISARPNFAASEAFLRKNWSHCSRTGWLLFATVMLERSYRAEGFGPNFRRYLELAATVDAPAERPLRAMAALLRVPRWGGRLFRAVTRKYCSASMRRRA